MITIHVRDSKCYWLPPEKENSALRGVTAINMKNNHDVQCERISHSV